MIINSYLRRSWRCNASAGKHLFHSVHHWTKEGNLDCNLKNYFSPSLQPVVWGVVNNLCRRVDILSRARSRLPPAEKHLRPRWSHLGLSPSSSCCLTGGLGFLVVCTSAIIISSLRSLLQTETFPVAWLLFGRVQLLQCPYAVLIMSTNRVCRSMWKLTDHQGTKYSFKFR